MWQAKNRTKWLRGVKAYTTYNVTEEVNHYRYCLCTMNNHKPGIRGGRRCLCSVQLAGKPPPTDRLARDTSDVLYGL